MCLKTKGKVFEYKGFTITRTKNPNYKSVPPEYKYKFVLETKPDGRVVREQYAYLQTVKNRIAVLIEEKKQQDYENKILKIVCEGLDSKGLRTSGLTIPTRETMSFLETGLTGMVEHVVRLELKIKELEERLPKKKAAKKKAPKFPKNTFTKDSSPKINKR